MSGVIIFPDGTKWWVKVLRFCNVLDDGANMLSPTKVNLWSAFGGAIMTATATGVAWAHNSVTGVEHLWAPVGTWMTHAMTAHHFDKKERNRTAVALAATKDTQPE